jgi:hypothetical protein
VRNESNDLSGEPSTTNIASTLPETALDISEMRSSKLPIDPSFL